MNQVIIFKHDEGVAVIVPAQDAITQFGIDFIAAKDTPSGKPFKIIDQEGLPDPSTRNLWDIDEADLTDGVGAPFGAGTDDVVIGYDLANGIVALRNEVSGELKAYNFNTQQFVEIVE
jgi:antitoxin (DNA-binding transcriptional repressor) of toxin-antitoxin stability system